jgi:hypothetical protein
MTTVLLATPPTETTPTPTTLAHALRLISDLQSDIADLLSQRNAAEETVRRYAVQADLDTVTLREWERLGTEWAQERASLESRVRLLEKGNPHPPRIHLHIHVHTGGVVNVMGGAT